MSDLVIKDGTGTGVRARVDGSNRLACKSVVEAEIERFSKEEGSAFAFSSVENAILSSGGEYHILWIRNNDTNKIFHVNKINVSFNGGNTTGNKVMTVRMRVGSTIPNSNKTVTTGGNLNLTSANVALVEAYYWNGTGSGMGITVPGPVALSSYFTAGTNQVTFDGALIVGFNNIVSFSVQTPEDGLASIIISGWFDTLND